MDYLKECMNDVGNPPLDAMHRNFCIGCANRQCDRAGLNQSSFDNRVKNWRSLLFDDVPRAEPGDERYSNIESKRFSPAGPSRPPATAIFMPGVPTITRPSTLVVPSAFVKAEEAREDESPVAPPELELPPPFAAHAPAAPAIPEPRPSATPGNTPFEQGMVLDGAPAPKPDPAGSQAQGKTFILDDD